jgi:hypothetical protein
LQCLAHLRRGYLPPSHPLPSAGFRSRRLGHLHVFVSLLLAVLAFIAFLASVVLFTSFPLTIATRFQLQFLVPVQMRKLLLLVHERHLVRRVERRRGGVPRKCVERVVRDAALLREAPSERARLLVILLV